MSGPKQSDLELKEQERKRQEKERQRRIEEERKRKEEEQCQKLHTEIQASFLELSQIKHEIEALEEIITEGKTKIATHFNLTPLEQCKNTLLRQIQQFPLNYKTRKSSVMSRYLRALKELKASLKHMQHGELSRLLSELQQVLNEQERAKASEEFLEQSKDFQVQQNKKYDLKLQKKNDPQLEAQVHVELLEFESLLFPYLNESTLFSKTAEVRRAFNAVQDSMKRPNGTLEDQRSQIQRMKKNFLLVQFQYDQEIAANQKLVKEMNDLHISYLSLTALLEIPAESYDLEFHPLKTHGTISTLKQDLKRLNETLQHKEEAAYISESIQEIMEELNYEIIATDFLSTPKRETLHHIYEMPDGNAVNVFTSDNGSLMFEVTGISDGKQEMSSLEQLKITESMESFCEDYPRIKEKLRHKGIRFLKENCKPAHEKYARLQDMSQKKRSKKRHKRVQTQKRHERTL